MCARTISAATPAGSPTAPPDQLRANFAKTVAAGWPIMCHADGLVGSLATGKAAEIDLLATYLDGAEVHSAGYPAA